MTEIDNDILTVEEVSEYLFVEEFFVQQLARNQVLPAWKVNGEWRFSKREIDEAYARRTARRIAGAYERLGWQLTAKELDELAARDVAEHHALIAKWKATMLRNQVDKLTAQESESKPPAWRFWRRG